MDKKIIRQKEIIKVWDRLAFYWDEHFGDKDLLKPEIFDQQIVKILKENKARIVLDAGCGEGYLSRKITNLVSEIIAVDLSDNLIKLARKKSKGMKNIYFHLADCSNMKFVRDETVDVVIGQMLINNVYDLEKVFTEFYRVLRIKGIVVLTLSHPCFMVPDSSRWVEDSDGSYHKEIFDYFNEGLKKFHLNDRKILTYHRTLSTVFNALVLNKFQISRVVECKATKKLVKSNPKYSRMYKIPNYMIIEASK